MPGCNHLICPDGVSGGSASFGKFADDQAALAHLPLDRPRKSTNMRHLVRMARAWKNANGVVMGGLHIHSLVQSVGAEADRGDIVPREATRSS